MNLNMLHTKQDFKDIPVQFYGNKLFMGLWNLFFSSFPLW